MNQKEIEQFYISKCGKYSDFTYRHVEYINRKIHYSYIINIIKYATNSHVLLTSDKQILASLIVLCII